MAFDPVNTDDNTIKVKLSAGSTPVEYISFQNIIPGLLCDIRPSSVGHIVPTEVRKHLIKQGTAIPMFAVEDSLHGRSIDYVSSIGARIPLIICRPGDIVLAWVTIGDSAAPDLEEGTRLTSFGDGNLQPAWGVPLTNIEVKGIVAESMQSKTIDAVPQRVLVKII